MYKSIILIFVFIPLLSPAQVGKLDLGISAYLYGKVSTRSSSTMTDKNISFAKGLGVSLKVNGADETAMNFLLNMGILEDSRPFGIDVFSTVYTSLYFLKINPSVTISSRWTGIYYSLGIGALVRIGEHASVAAADPPYGTGYTTADTVKNLMNSVGNSVIPFVSLGLSVNIKKHLQLQFSVEPALLNFYQPGTTLHFRSSNTIADISMDYQPVYFGVKPYYFIYSNSHYE